MSLVNFNRCLRIRFSPILVTFNTGSSSGAKTSKIPVHTPSVCMPNPTQMATNLSLMLEKLSPLRTAFCSRPTPEMATFAHDLDPKSSRRFTQFTCGTRNSASHSTGYLFGQPLSWPSIGCGWICGFFTGVLLGNKDKSICMVVNGLFERGIGVWVPISLLYSY